MSNFYDTPFGASHDHVFLGEGHEKNERKTWAVIVLCTLMMAAEIIGGSVFGSLALVADGLHMSTHAGAMLIAALAYTYARRHANDPRFVFGTGKLGDLAGFTSAIILAMIALLIGYEAVVRFLSPVPIHFSEAIPIAVVGLLVNIASAWLATHIRMARKCSTSTRRRACLRCRSSKMAYRQCSDWLEKPLRCPAMWRRSPPSGQTAAARNSSWSARRTIWNPPQRFRSHMPSLR